MKLPLRASMLRGFAVALSLLCLAWANPGIAQQALTGSASQEASPLSELDAPLTKEAVREMVSLMSDDAVRAFLIQRLDAVAEAEQAASEVTAWDAVEAGFETYWDNALLALSGLGRIPSLIEIAATDVSGALAPDGLGALLFRLLLGLACGVAAERLIAWLLRGRKQRLIERVDTTLWGIVSTIYARLIFDILGVLAFAVVSFAVVSGKYAAQTLPGQLAYTVIATVGAGWLAWVVGRFFFSPGRADLRICQTSDELAQRLTLSYTVLAAYIVMMHNLFGLMLMVGLEKLGGWSQFAPLGFSMNISMYLAAVFVVWWNRDGLSEVLLENKRRVHAVIGEEAPVAMTWFAGNWPLIAGALIVCKYLLVEIVVNSTDVAVYSTAAVYITFIVVFLWPAVDANVSLFVGKGIQSNDEESDAAARARRRMQQSLLRVGRVLVVGVVLYALAWLWGVNVLSLAEAGLGAKVAERLLEAVLVALIAYLLLEFVSIFCSRWLAAEGGDPDDQPAEPGSGGDGGGVGLSRVATLLPIVKRTSQTLIVLISIMIVLSEWGINIGPILAGAGVVGLAIGFGAQTLVKDIVSGMFFLFDDAFRVGEYIEIDGTMGSVEKISLRSLRLRHHKGLVHTIPYGEIPKLTNYSRDWVIMKLRFRVPFDADINKVKKIFKQIGKDLLQDPLLGDDFLQPFKSQGVADVDDDGIIVRGKFMAKPGTQFMIRKEIYVRVQKAFEENGIPFARKQVMVHIPGLDKDSPLSPEEMQSVGAAAAEAAQARDRTGGQPATP